MEEGTTYVGMDVHKRTIAVSIRFPDGGRDERTIPHETRAVNRFVQKMKREAPGPILCAYEAGPCGYGLQRELKEQGLACQVIAPSLIPRKPGDRIKTDRRDARKLAELLEGGLLTEVHPPSPEDEADGTRHNARYSDVERLALGAHRGRTPYEALREKLQ